MKLQILIFLCFTSSMLLAQIDERNVLKASVGISRHMQEKATAPTILVAFNRDFVPNTQIEISATWSVPVDVSTEEEEIDLQLIQFNTSLLYKVLAERKQAFNIGIGFSAGFYGLDKTVIATEEELPSTEFIPGFTAIAEYNYILPSQWFIGARTSIARYNADRSAWFLGAVLGYRF